MAVSRAYKAGVTPKGVARQAARKAHNPNYRPRGRSGWEMNADSRAIDLANLARERARTGAGLVNEDGWIRCIANMIRVREQQVTDAAVQAEARRLQLEYWFGVGRLDPVLVSIAVREIAQKAWGLYPLYSPDEAGKLLRVTREERTRAGLLKINAQDETRKERRAREAREARAAARSRRPVLKPMRDVISELAEELSVSQATVYRRIKIGEISECEISHRRSISPSEITRHAEILMGATA